MSIFPKRTVPGSNVTIHWNFNTSSLRDVHIFPWVRIGVKSPGDQITMLHEGHLLALPNSEEVTSTTQQEKKKLQYLNKNIPILILADYLSGKLSREKLVEILRNIQSGRHYYFTFQVAENAPLGKYTLISEVHNSGQIRYSNTAADDFFLVEKVSIDQVSAENQGLVFRILNHSPEPTPIKLIACFPEESHIKTQVEVFELMPQEQKYCSAPSKLAFLSYNEERQLIPICESPQTFLLRNQEVLAVSKNTTQSHYLFKKDKEEAYELTEESKTLWEKANGLLSESQLSSEEHKILLEMIEQDLIHRIHF